MKLALTAVVSALALASDPAHFRQAVYAIERVWRDFRVHQVFKTDIHRRAHPGMPDKIFQVLKRTLIAMPVIIIGRIRLLRIARRQRIDGQRTVPVVDRTVYGAAVQLRDVFHDR